MKNICLILAILTIDFYGSDYCMYCLKAQNILDSKGLKYNKHDTQEQKIRYALHYRTNGTRSIPQIFINDKHIGGYSALYELEKSGELDKMIKA